MPGELAACFPDILLQMPFTDKILDLVLQVVTNLSIMIPSSMILAIKVHIGVNIIMGKPWRVDQVPLLPVCEDNR